MNVLKTVFSSTIFVLPVKKTGRPLHFNRVLQRSVQYVSEATGGSYAQAIPSSLAWYKKKKEAMNAFAIIEYINGIFMSVTFVIIFGPLFSIEKLQKATTLYRWPITMLILLRREHLFHFCLHKTLFRHYLGLSCFVQILIKVIF